MRRLASAVPAICLVSTIFALKALALISGGSFFASAVPAEETPVEALFFETGLGVRVLYGPDEPVPIAGYSFEPAEDDARILAALTKLKGVLEKYPEGFFESLTGGDPNRLVFELTGGVRADVEGLVDRPAAVTSSTDGVFVIALDVSDPYSDPSPVIVHELCHVIDRRLDELSKLDPSHWNAADWAALNPAGFSYYYAYFDEKGRSISLSGDPSFTPDEEGEIWFINRYSKTYPTEDRAVMTEYLFGHGSNISSLMSPRVTAKLEYYFAAIRYYLDPSGLWGETFWEAKLKAVRRSPHSFVFIEYPDIRNPRPRSRPSMPPRRARL